MALRHFQAVFILSIFFSLKPRNLAPVAGPMKNGTQPNIKKTKF